MKKSLVAVLLSLVALTLVAGAAFAGASFDIEAKVDGTAQKIEVKDWKEASADVKAGTAVADITFSTTKEAIELTAQTSVEFAIASPDQGFKLSVYPVKSDKTLDAAKSGAITETGEFVLAAASAAASDDIVFAFNAKVTISGGDNPTPTLKEATLKKSSDAAVTTAKGLLGVEVVDGTQYQIPFALLSSPDIEAINNSELANLLGVVFDIPDGVEAIIFGITLDGIEAQRILTWLKLALSSGSTGSVEIAGSATEIEQVYYISDEGKQIMENNTTEKANQEVNVAFKVSKGLQAVAVKGEKAPEGGGSPSSGCDMGLLGSLALFAVALLPLRKSR